MARLELEGELLDVLMRKPKSVAELREILPPSITDRLGQGEEGLTRTVSMLRNLTTQIIFDPIDEEGTHLDDVDFAERVAMWIYFRDDPYFKIKEGTPSAQRISLRESIMERTLAVQQPMLRLALEGGILEEHQGWASPGETPKPYRLPTSTHRLLRRIFRP